MRARVRKSTGLPPGPKTLPDLLNWPGNVLSTLDTKQMELLQKNIYNGVSLRTLYSGIDNPSAALGFLEDAMHLKGIATGSYVPDLP
jgi:hypothetical protein